MLNIDARVHDKGLFRPLEKIHVTDFVWEREQKQNELDCCEFRTKRGKKKQKTKID